MSLTHFFNEKDFEIRTYEVTGRDGETHLIDTNVVIDAIQRTTGNERVQVINTLQALDFQNGNFHHFFAHLAKGLAMNY